MDYLSNLLLSEVDQPRRVAGLMFVCSAAYQPGKAESFCTAPFPASQPVEGSAMGAKVTPDEFSKNYGL
jgi:hypothetical protein